MSVDLASHDWSPAHDLLCFVDQAFQKKNYLQALQQSNVSLKNSQIVLLEVLGKSS